MASLREHHGRWQVRYRDPAGHQRARSFARKSDAKVFAAAVETDMLRGNWSDPKLGNVTFEAWVKEWRSTLVHLKPSSLAGYDGLLRRHLLPAFGPSPLAAITTPQVRSFVAGLAGEVSASWLRQAYGLLAQILKAAVESGYLAKTPCIGVKIPRGRPRDLVVLEPELIDALAAALPEPYGLLVYVLAYGGLRWGEAGALRRERCDILRARLEVAEALTEVNGHLYFGSTKTYARRSVRLPRFVAEMLGAHLAKVPPGGLVFTGQRGAPLRRSNFRRRIWREAAVSIGVPGLTPHHLRHTCASLLIRGGASVKIVQAQLGHATPAITLNVYTQLFPDDLDTLWRDVDQVWTKRGPKALDPPAK